MSFRDNEPIDLIMNTIEADLFRYIVVQYNLFPAIKQLKKTLEIAFPHQKVVFLSIVENGYGLFMQKLYAFQNEIVIVPDFDLLLENDTWRIAFNQQRDKLSLQHKVNLLACIPDEKEYFELCAKGIADFWSIRHLSVRLEVEFIAEKIEIEMFKPSFRDWQPVLSERELKERYITYKSIDNRLRELEDNETNRELIFVLLFQKIHIMLDVMYFEEIISQESSFLFWADGANIELKIRIYNCISIAYTEINNLERALLFAKKTIELVENGEAIILISALLYDNLAYIYEKMQNYEDSLYYYEKAIKVAEALPSINIHVFIANHEDTIGMLSLIQHKHKEAKKHLLESLYIKDFSIMFHKDIFLLAISHYHLALYHYTLQDPFHAKYYLDKAAETLPQDHPNYSLILQLQAKIKNIPF